jgi:mannitol-1-phosphate 5-dehydrogenase
VSPAGGAARKTLLQFGAGSIGRSLCGALFSRAGYEVVFVDVDRRLVEALDRAGGYQVVVRDREPAVFQVENVRAVHAADAGAVAREAAGADIAATAVGAAALPAVAELLAAGLAARGGRALDVLLCENLREAAALMRAELARNLAPRPLADFHVGLVETSIGKMVPIMPAAVREQDPTVVWAEAYNQIIADRQAFTCPPPGVEGLVTKAHFRAWVDRKLFVHNLGHAAAAYLGHLAGARLIWEAVEMPPVRDLALGAMRESGRALLAAYPGEWTAAGMEAHIQDLLARFANRALGDTVYRVGRDLARKLAPNDRLAGALRFQLAAGVEPACTCRAIAAALLFRATDESGRTLLSDAEVAEFAAKRGPCAALERYAGLDAAGTDRAAVERIIEEGGRLELHPAAGKTRKSEE